MSTDEKPIRKAVLDGIEQLRHHPSVYEISGGTPIGDDSYSVEVVIAVQLPSRVRAAGVSATGVRDKEPVVFRFGKQWPFKAPDVGLRKDFPLHFPHINPHYEGELVRPCIYEGSTSELLQREGLDALVDQLAIWLSKAAAGTLMNLGQGWEPRRRDSVAGVLAFDADTLLTLVDESGAPNWLPVIYQTFNDYFHGIVGDRRQRLWFSAKAHKDSLGRFVGGTTSALLIGVKHVGGNAPIVDSYQPESVRTLADLYDTANGFGMDVDALRAAVKSHLDGSRKHANAFAWPDPFCLAIILAVRRPAPLISAFGRDIELLPYVVRYAVTSDDQFARDATVEPVSHEQTINPRLLRMTSGTKDAVTDQMLAIWGCGSLGSKIALHLARAGFGNLVLVDRDRFSSHNLARHALLMRPERPLFPYKSLMMGSLLDELGHDGGRPVFEDVTKLLINDRHAKKAVPDDVAFVIDATASQEVLEAACGTDAIGKSTARYVRSALISAGACCFAAMEGVGRNPRADDLQAVLFAHVRSTPTLRALLTGQAAQEDRIFVGQNCSSVTTVLDDAHISRSASIVSVQIGRWLEQAPPREGVLGIGVQDSSGIGMQWQTIACHETTVLHTESAGGWEIRVVAPVRRQIEQDVARWRPCETGGAIVGHVHWGRRCIVIGGLVEAPPDSKRTPTRFLLGTDGLEDALRAAHRDSQGYLHFVGTWHSHPAGGPISLVDQKTLDEIANWGAGLPVISLVWTPAGFLCEVQTSWGGK